MGQICDVSSATVGRGERVKQLSVEYIYLYDLLTTEHY